MEIKELRIGDIVCNKRTKYPMKVVGIYEDGTVYLDFDGNEGDVFEENCKDLEFAELKPEEIKRADETIPEAIEKGIVGVGYKDKRMC